MEYCPGASTIFDSSVKSGDKPIKVNYREFWDGISREEKGEDPEEIQGDLEEIQEDPGETQKDGRRCREIRVGRAREGTGRFRMRDLGRLKERQRDSGEMQKDLEEIQGGPGMGAESCQEM